MPDQFNPHHPHEPAIPPALDADGRCLVCILTVERDRARDALIALVDHYHRTRVNSRLHAPDKRDWPECPCRTCQRVADLLPAQAGDALRRYREERKAHA